ncbi:MAG: SurA N-terminal domain-containing protein, partial [Methylophilaceae bacterium]
MLKKITLAISLYFLQSFFLIASLTANQEYIEIDSIVAIVEKDIISKKQLDKALNQKKYNWQKQGKDLPDEQILIKKTLDELINKSIIMQYANHSGIKISQEQLIGVIQNIANKNKLSIDNLKKNIESNGGDFAIFKDQIYFELTVNQLKIREITSRLIISEFEIDNFLALKKKIAPENYNLSHILIEISDNPTQEETSNHTKKINEALKALNKKTFEEV